MDELSLLLLQRVTQIGGGHTAPFPQYLAQSFFLQSVSLPRPLLLNTQVRISSSASRSVAFNLELLDELPQLTSPPVAPMLSAHPPRLSTCSPPPAYRSESLIDSVPRIEIDG